MTQPQANQVPTLPRQIVVDDIDEQSDKAPARDPARMLVDELVRTQRTQAHRLVPFQPNHGLPIRNQPKPPAEAIKQFRKTLKKRRRAWMQELTVSTPSETMETLTETHAPRPDFG